MKICFGKATATSRCDRQKVWVQLKQIKPTLITHLMYLISAILSNFEQFKLSITELLGGGRFVPINLENFLGMKKTYKLWGLVP
jgi:hypothetical protein